MINNKIGMFGVPRSGTSWLSQIFNSHPKVAFRYQPLFSYTHKGRLTENSTKEQISDFFDEILNSQDEYVMMKTESQKGNPTFLKDNNPSYVMFKETRYLQVVENILLRCSDVKIIGLVRNPLATMASWVKAPREFYPDWDVLDEWRFAPSKNQGKVEEYFGFEKWKQVATEFLSFQKEYPEQFCLVRYEELRENPLDKTKEIFQFCGLDSNTQVEEFLVQSRSKYDANPYSVFRSKTTGDDWNEILPAVISDSIKSELSDSPLRIFLN
tara:strand:+ start:3524 stop:4330 length:807 start_codon:yes stop_codon:yes gene_type:complete